MVEILAEDFSLEAALREDLNRTAVDCPADDTWVFDFEHPIERSEEFMDASHAFAFKVVENHVFKLSGRFAMTTFMARLQVWDNAMTLSRLGHCHWLSWKRTIVSCRSRKVATKTFDDTAQANLPPMAESFLPRALTAIVRRRLCE